MSAHLYYTVYLLIIFIVTIVLYSRYSKKKWISSPLPSADTTMLHGRKRKSWMQNRGITHEDNIMFFVVAALTLFIGLRPESGVFMDMVNYIQHYHTFFEGESFVFDWNTENLLFDNFIMYCGSLRLGTEFFFTVIAAIYFGASYLGIRKLFPRDRVVAYFVFLAAFSTFSYATNGVKAGAAASLFILALAYRENFKVAIPLALISLGFHHSMVMPVAAYVLCYFIRNPKYYFAGWIFCLAMAVLHISYFQVLFASFSDESGAGYLLSSGKEWGGQSGLRLDFIAYSFMPIWVGYKAIYEKKIRSTAYNILLNFYLTTNAVWMLCMYASFTNRIAYLSWFIYPVVLIYPFLNCEWSRKQYKQFANVMLLHILFTIFMQGIYYGGFFR